MGVDVLLSGSGIKRIKYVKEYRLLCEKVSGIIMQLFAKKYDIINQTGEIEFDHKTKKQEKQKSNTKQNKTTDKTGRGYEEIHYGVGPGDNQFPMYIV